MSLHSFWCCTGTGVENHAQYGDSIYFHSDTATLYVNLFIASELNWKERGLKVRQETPFPSQGLTRLIMGCAKPVKLEVRLRHPFWASTFSVRVNEKVEKTKSAPGEWVALKRTWRNGDRIAVTMPFALHTEGFSDNPDRFAFLNGPLVLAAQVEPGKPFPALVGERARATAALTPASAPNTFTEPPRPIAGEIGLRT